jgi:hypothetical protein
MPAFSPEVLADPLGVVTALLASRAPGLGFDTIEQVVARVAPTRATRRRLAQALVDRPAMLADGRSPAPRAVAELPVAMGE